MSFIINGYKSQNQNTLENSEFINSIKKDLDSVEKRFIQLLSEGSEFHYMLLSLQYVQSKIYNSSTISMETLAKILEIIKANFNNLTPTEIAKVSRISKKLDFTIIPIK